MRRLLTFAALATSILCGDTQPTSAQSQNPLPVTRRWETPHRIFTLAISDDGKLVVAVGPHGLASIWDTQTGELVRFCKGTRDDGTCAAISPDKSRLAIGGIEGEVKIFDLTSGNLLYSQGDQGSRLMHVGFAPNSDLVVSSSWDTFTRWWHVGVNKVVGKTTSMPVGMCAFAVSDSNGTLVLPGLFPDLGAHPGVPMIAPLDMVSLSDGKKTAEIHRDVTDWTVAVSPDDRFLAAGTSTGAVTVWEASTKKAVGNWSVKTVADDSIGNGIVSLGFLGDGKRLFAMTMCGFGGVYDAKTGERVASLERPTVGFVSVALAPKMCCGVISDWNRSIELFALPK